MYIRSEKTDWSWSPPEIDDRVTFNDDGIARCSEDVGETLANEYPDLVEIDAYESNDGSESDESTETDEDES